MKKLLYETPKFIINLPTDSIVTVSNGGEGNMDELGEMPLD